MQPDGSIVWSNALTGTNYVVQSVAALPAGTNWVDYVQLPVTQSINTNQIVAFTPPADMSFVPAGSFTMGDTLDGDFNATPLTIYVSAFYVDKNLVSYGQWQTIYLYATNHGYAFDDTGSGTATNYPVMYVNWFDCAKWCDARSQQAGLTPVYYADAGLTQLYTNGDLITVYPNWAANGFRLPTEAEWEKAARGGLIGQRFPWGMTISENQANYEADTNLYGYDLGPYNGFNTNFYNALYLYFTSPVGYFAPNNYGLYDMAGNAKEWCWDWYGTPYGQPTTTNPTGPGYTGDRIVRGGNYGYTANYARCAARDYSIPYGASQDISFRCVRSP